MYAILVEAKLIMVVEIKIVVAIVGWFGLRKGMKKLPAVIEMFPILIGQRIHRYMYLSKLRTTCLKSIFKKSVSSKEEMEPLCSVQTTLEILCSVLNTS